LRRLQLVISVDYVPNGTPDADLYACLYHIADHAAGDGWLTSNTDAVVEEWSAIVVTPKD